MAIRNLPETRPFAKIIKRSKLIFAYFSIFFSHKLLGSYYRNLAEFGSSLEFSLWLSREFGGLSRFVPTRDRVWQLIIAELQRNRPVLVFEFGVACGNVTRWWLKRCPEITAWYGFDTFTGLDRPWRHWPAGAFDVDGRPPQISDPRVTWVTGRVEETAAARLHAVHSDASLRDAQCLYLFDLDLYEPTTMVLQMIIPFLKPDDMLYFDEAADLDERRAYLDFKDGANRVFTLVGATPIAMGLKVG